MKPESWRPGTVDAIATASADARRIVIKAVNYEPTRNTLLVRLQGTRVPENAAATLHTISAGLRDAASLEHPDAIAPVSRPITYAHGPRGGPGALHGCGVGDSIGVRRKSGRPGVEDGDAIDPAFLLDPTTGRLAVFRLVSCAGSARL